MKALITLLNVGKFDQQALGVISYWSLYIYQHVIFTKFCSKGVKDDLYFTPVVTCVYKVHPTKYAHFFNFVVVFVVVQIYFSLHADTGAITRLLQSQWNNPEVYGK